MWRELDQLWAAMGSEFGLFSDQLRRRPLVIVLSCCVLLQSLIGGRNGRRVLLQADGTVELSNLSPLEAHQSDESRRQQLESTLRTGQQKHRQRARRRTREASLGLLSDEARPRSCRRLWAHLISRRQRPKCSICALSWDQAIRGRKASERVVVLRHEIKTNTDKDTPNGLNIVQI